MKPTIINSMCVATTLFLIVMQSFGHIDVSWGLILAPVLWPVYLVSFILALVVAYLAITFAWASLVAFCGGR